MAIAVTPSSSSLVRAAAARSPDLSFRQIADQTGVDLALVKKFLREGPKRRAKSVVK